VISELVWLVVGGSAGTLCRFGLSSLVQSLTSDKFPWGTLTVNVIGCFLFGLIWSLAEERLVISDQTRLILLTGFCGAFTTFSTFGFETGELLRDSQWWPAIGNLLANNLAGIVAVLVGIAAGRWF